MKCLQGKPRFKDPLQALKSLSHGRGSATSFSGNKLYDARFMNRFIAGPHHKLIEEGILPQVANEFDIRFDPFRDRIVFPHHVLPISVCISKVDCVSNGTVPTICVIDHTLSLRSYRTSPPTLISLP